MLFSFYHVLIPMRWTLNEVIQVAVAYKIQRKLRFRFENVLIELLTNEKIMLLVVCCEDDNVIGSKTITIFWFSIALCQSCESYTNNRYIMYMYDVSFWVQSKLICLPFNRKGFSYEFIHNLYDLVFLYIFCMLTKDAQWTISNSHVNIAIRFQRKNEIPTKIWNNGTGKL